LKELEISPELQEKIYDLKGDNNGNILKITTYFPLKPTEQQEILKSFKKIKDPKVDFKSIFSDNVSEQEWINTKEQIKKKFQDELMDIN
jgi:hypothetical protein